MISHFQNKIEPSKQNEEVRVIQKEAGEAVADVAAPASSR